MPNAESHERYHERPLARSLAQLETAVSVLGGADETLGEAGVGDSQRAPIREAQMEIFELQSWIRQELKQSAAHAQLLGSTEHARPAVGEGGIAVPRPIPAQPSLQAATMLLFGPAHEADLETDTGQSVTVHLERALPGEVTATVARLTVSRGMTLTGRVVDDDRNPWQMRFECRSAVEQTQDAQTRVTLVPSGITYDDQRGASRLEIDATIVLRVVSGMVLHEGDEVRGQIIDLSPTGFAFTCDDQLRRGDRLALRTRFFEGQIEGEARVAAIHAERLTMIVGCWFVTLDEASKQVVDRVLDRPQHESAPFSYPELRSLLYHPD